MATSELQSAYTHHSEADVMPNSASRGADQSANAVKPSNVLELPRCANTGPAQSNNKIITISNAIIVLVIMLILLLSLQMMLVVNMNSPLCCESVITTKLTLPPPVEQPLRSAHVAVSPAPSVLARKPVIKSSAKSVTANAALATSMAEVATTDPEPVPELITVASASNMEPVMPAVTEDIKSDAVATLAAATESNFVKISNSGIALAESEAKWECVQDKSNNLTWEVKKNDGGMRDKDNSFSWLSSNSGKNQGIRNGGRCKGGINCDTSSYARAINEQKLCGYSDWRLPTREELETLIDYNNTSNGMINRKYFPEAIPSWYWSASENPQLNSHAWYVLFQNGIALNDLKERPKHVRLVRGNPSQ